MGRASFHKLQKKIGSLADSQVVCRLKITICPSGSRRLRLLAVGAAGPRYGPTLGVQTRFVFGWRAPVEGSFVGCCRAGPAHPF